jgi:hypothetical protein
MVAEKLSFSPTLLINQKREALTSANRDLWATSLEIEQMRDRGYLPLIDVQTSALIVKVLSDEHRFSDDPPIWAGAPSSRAAQSTRERSIKRLRRFAPGIPKADQLAKILARCKRRRRCMSGACPECGRAFQR